MAIDSEAIRDHNGEGTALERIFNRQVGNLVHLFLSVLAVLVMAAACISLVQIVRFDFPKLWATGNEYQTLHVILQSILLLAIAGELALLLLFIAPALPWKWRCSSLPEEWLIPMPPRLIY